MIQTPTTVHQATTTRGLWTFLLLALLLAACGSGGRASDELVLCSSLPLAGGTNARAVSMANAIDMAVDDAGMVEMDGITYRLRHVRLDDTDPESGKWDTAQEERNARAAIDTHDCLVYIGTFNSGAAKIAIPILNRVQMAMISPGNTYAGLTKPGTGIGDEPWIYSPLGPDRRNYCRVVPADDLQAPAAVRYAAESLGVERVFVFHDTELYGRGLADLFVAAAPNFGVEITGNLGVSSPRLTSGDGSATAYADEIAQTILDTAPDLVYFGGETASGPGFVLRALRARGYEGLFMGADAIAEQAFVQQGRAEEDDRIFATLVALPAQDLGEAGRNFAGEYQSRYGSLPDAFAAPSYEATQVVLQAIRQAALPPGEPGTLMERARPAVLEAIKQIRNYDGLLGTWSFDENCDTTLTTISINQVQGFDFMLVDIVESGP